MVFTQNITVLGAGRVNAVQHGDQYNYIYRGTPPYRVEPFPLTTAPAVPPGLTRVPSRLLTARHRVVPYFPRSELPALESWRDEPSLGLSVRLVYAEGGSGKTRLAHEFAALSAGAGWAVSLARHRSELASAGGEDESLTVRAPGLVMIVDYAERWPIEDLITLVRQHRAAARDRLRILLLSRTAGTWWQGLAHQFAKLDILDAAALRLEALPDTPGVRTGIYTQARDRFAEIFALNHPGGIGVPEDLDDPLFALTLTVHMRALVDVDAAARGQAPPTGSSQAALSSYLLDREHDHWRSSHDRGRGPVRTDERTMGRTVYVATLTRALAPSHAATALARAGLTDTTAAAGMIADHARCYPPADPGLVLDPLYPDRLGEDYLALTLPGREDEFGYHATDPWVSTAPSLLLEPAAHDGAPSYARQLLTVLIEAAHRWPHLTTHHLDQILRTQPALALSAGGAALTRLADLTTLDLDVLEAIEPHLPDHAHVDLDLGAAALTSRLIEQRLATTTDPAIHARLYRKLGWRYANAGLYPQALESTQQAVDLGHSVAKRNPAAPQPDLAAALNNLGVQLSKMGRRAEAIKPTEQAVAIRRQLAAQNPVHEPDLAASLSNLGNRLWEMGRWAEAVEPTEQAVNLYRRLAEIDSAAHEPDLAMALSNLGILQSDMGRLAEAIAPIEQAVDLYRRLAEQAPATHEPNLAGSLSNLGVLQRELGQLPEAKASTEPHRDRSRL